MAFSMAWPRGAVQGGQGGEQAGGLLAAFRGELFRCFGRYRDTLAEVCDAVLCKQDRVHMAAGLSLDPECRRGHGAVYKALNRGQVQVARLRWALAGLPLPAWDDGRIRLAVDVSNWLRPDAATSPERLFCHCYARGRGNAQMIPGWPYSLVAALEPGRTSWTLPLDAVRPGPADDATEVTAAQVRQVVAGLTEAGHWHDGDPDILIVLRLRLRPDPAGLAADGPPRRVHGRAAQRPGHVLPRTGTPARRRRPPGAAREPRSARQRAILARPGGDHRHRDRPVRHCPGRGLGPGAPAAGQPRRMGPSRRRPARHRGHPDPAARRSPARQPKPGAAVAVVLTRRDVRRGSRPAPGRRSCAGSILEHTFRFLKQVLGWTRPKLRDPAAADRWTWLILACHAQLYLARHLAADLRLPWQRPCPPGRLTPARVRRGFRNIRQALPCLAGAPKPGKPGPGRPPGSKNRHPATRHDVGKTVKRDEPKKETPRQKG